MTTYTTPHSLPILETSDKIAAPSDGLLVDINALALTTNTAITAEGARAEGSAKTYADDKDTTNRSAWASADATNLTAAKGYADSQDTARLTDSKAYTDTQDAAYRVVDRALWRSEDDGHQAAAEANAKTYTDSQDAAYRVVDRALWRSEDDGHQAAAEANAATYTDTKDVANRAAWAASDAANLAAAKAYTDAGIAPDRVRLADIEAKNTVQDARLGSLEAVSPKVSNIALDTDGNPYYSPGSTEVHVIPDGDGEPYYITFLQASADTDGTPYF